MKIGTNGLNLIKKFEGCKLTAYKNPKEIYYTIGYGHVDPSIREGQKITQKKAEEYLLSDLGTAEKEVNNYVSDFKLNQNQFDALVSYCYNRGRAGLRELINHSVCADDIRKNIVIYWGSNQACKAGIMNRRIAEQKLFCTPVEKTSTKTNTILPTHNPYDIFRPSSSEIYKMSSRGGSVKWIQYVLNQAGYTTVIDGIYGSNTKNAVKKYQKANNLYADGIVGPKTLKVMLKQ